MSDTRKVLKELISKGETKQVIKQLLDSIVSDSPQHNKVVLLSGQFTTIENQSQLGLTDPKQISIEIIRINAALVEVIDTLSENDKSQVKPYWKRHSWLGLIPVLIGLLAYLNDLGVFPFKNPDNPIIVEPTIVKPTNPGPFPEKFDSTTLYVLITRFEDYATFNRTECYGEGFVTCIEDLKNQRNLPVSCHYVHGESPNKSDDANRLRDLYHADLIIWGKLRNAGPNCSSEGFCLKFLPSDTLIQYAGGQVKRHLDNDYQPNISAIDIEEGLVKMDTQRFKDWLVGMSNLKVGRKKPELFYIDENWPTNKKAEAFKSRGLAWQSLKLYEKASVDFRQSIRLMPQDVHIYFLSWDCEYRLGNYESLVNYIDLDIKLDPKNGFAYGYRGAAKSNLGRYTEAIADFDRGIELNPGDAIAYTNRGLAKSSLGLHAEALTDLDKAIQLNQSNANAYLNRGTVKDKLGRRSEAIADLDKAAELDPKNATIYCNRGDAKKHLGRHSEAIVDYSKAIELDPKYSNAYNNRGLAKINLERYTEAIVDCDKAIELDPNAASYLNRGFAKAKLVSHIEAITDFDKSIELDPKNAAAYRNRGGAKNYLKRSVEAIADFDKTISFSSKEAFDYYERGTAKIDLGYYLEAIIDFDKAIELDPKKSAAYNTRGFANINLGLYEEAIADCDKAIKLDPKLTSAYNNRGAAKYGLGHYAEAISDYDKAIELTPNSTDIIPNRILAQQMQAQYGPIKEDKWREIRHVFKKFWWLLLVPFFIYFGARWLKKKPQSRSSRRRILQSKHPKR